MTYYQVSYFSEIKLDFEKQYAKDCNLCIKNEEIFTDLYLAANNYSTFKSISSLESENLVLWLK